MFCVPWTAPRPSGGSQFAEEWHLLLSFLFLSLFSDQFVEQAISHCSCLAGLDLSFLGDDSYFKLPNDSFIVIQTDLYDSCLPERTISQKEIAWVLMTSGHEDFSCGLLFCSQQTCWPSACQLSFLVVQMYRKLRILTTWLCFLRYECVVRA